MTYASFLQRLSGALIDSVIFLFAVSFFTRGHENDPATASLIFLVALFFTLVFVAFVSVRYSGTPGILLLNCQVVDAETGDPVTSRQAVLRSLGLCLTIMTFSCRIVAMQPRTPSRKFAIKIFFSKTSSLGNSGGF